jgi:hypothetical protein
MTSTLPNKQTWQHGWSRSSLEFVTDKFHPWLPSDLAALIRY